MRNTTYYNLNIVEGTDIVNPLTVDNPNYEKIDETMHNNAVSGVTLATEIANATVHAITRENSECAVIRFIATSAWKAGDTATVDGVPVTALLPSGETLPDGAYVINSNVLCILTGTNMTVFAERKKTDNANDIKYNDTNVGAELDKVNSNLSKKVPWAKAELYGVEIFFGNGALSIKGQQTVNDAGHYATLILQETGWAEIIMIIPVMYSSVPVVMNVQNNVIYAYSVQADATYDNVRFEYIALGHK